MQTAWLVIAFLSGACLPIQGGLNAKIGKAVANSIYGSAVSFMVEIFAIGSYKTAARQTISWHGFKMVSPYANLGGVPGAFYVTAIILALPQIGPALTRGLVATRQMALSVVLDHFGMLVQQPHQINAWRIYSVLLMMLGVILLRKF